MLVDRVPLDEVLGDGVSASAALWAGLVLHSGWYFSMSPSAPGCQVARVRPFRDTEDSETAATGRDNVTVDIIGDKVGQELDVRIRPSDVKVLKDGTGISAKLELIEPVGPESILTLNVIGVHSSRRCPPGSATGSQRKIVALQMPIEKLLLFDSTEHPLSSRFLRRWIRK